MTLQQGVQEAIQPVFVIAKNMVPYVLIAKKFLYLCVGNNALFM